MCVRVREHVCEVAPRRNNDKNGEAPQLVVVVHVLLIAVVGAQCCAGRNDVQNRTSVVVGGFY